MAKPILNLAYSYRGSPQKRPYVLSWTLSWGKIRDKNHLRTYLYQRMREGSYKPRGDFVTNQFSCITQWPSFKGVERIVLISGDDKFNSRRLDMIHFVVSVGSGKNLVSCRANFYHGRGYPRYLLRNHSTQTPLEDIIAPEDFVKPENGAKLKYFGQREVGRLFENETQLEKSTKDNPAGKSIKIGNYFFVPFDSSQYSEREEPAKELFRKFNELYRDFRTRFAQGEFLGTQPKIIHELLGPRFRELIRLSLKNKLIYFPEPKITLPAENPIPPAKIPAQLLFQF